MPNKYEVNPLETHKNKFAKEMDFRQSWIEQDMVQNDQDVHFLGLAHSIEIFNDPDLASKIEQGIERSSIVVSEGGIKSEELTEENVKQYVGVFLEALKISKRGIVSEEDIINDLRENESLAFFHQIENICHQKGKPIAIVDPYDRLVEAVILRNVNEQAIQTKIKLMIGALGGATSIVIMDKIISAFWERYSDKDVEIRSQPKKEPLISRRQSIMMAGMLIASPFVLSLMTKLNRIIKSNSTDENKSPNFLDLFGHDLIDFRNVGSAVGLDTLTKELNSPNGGLGDINTEKGGLTVIGGCDHTKFIIDYLQNETKRNLKWNQLYELGGFKEKSEPTVRVYIPAGKIGNDNNWKEIYNAKY